MLDILSDDMCRLSESLVARHRRTDAPVCLPPRHVNKT